jgi:hypothetical protein
MHKVMTNNYFNIQAINSNEMIVLDYITNIRSMDENSQTVIMQCIQDLERIQGHPQSIITTSIGVDNDHHEQIQQLIDELQAVTKARDQMTQRCLELDSQVIIFKILLYEKCFMFI